MNMNMRLAQKLAPLLIALLFLSGCNREKNGGESKATAATQVAAKVNAEEITVHQINSVLARNANVKPETASAAKMQILNHIIDQTLAKQEAIHTKIDRIPAVVQAIESARAEILARAYLEKLAAAQPRPTDEEIKKYYADHPELFARRKIFSIEEIVVAPAEGLAEKLEQQVAKARSLQDVAAWLKSQNAKFAANRGIRTAEQLPMEQLPRIQEMKDGAIKVIADGPGPIHVIQLMASKAAPVDEATAANRISQYLFNRRSADLIQTEMKRLHDKAEITYLGEFANDAAGATARAKADAAAKAKAEAEAKAKADADARAREEALSKARADAEMKSRLEAEAKAREAAASKSVQLPQGSVEKGLRGIK